MAELTKEWLKQTIAEYEANRDELPFGLDTNSAIELQAFKLALASLEAEPVSQAYNLPELIEGMEVSIDVSTCDADLGNRYFGTVTEALELDTAKNGYILLVQDAEPNFDINGNSPVTPDGYADMLQRWLVFGIGMLKAGSQLPRNLIAETKAMVAALQQEDE
ncbi:hypothetical protein ACU8JW_000452 [Escherichia coli]